MTELVHRWRHLLLVLFVAVLFLPGLGGEFISDDWPMIADNPHLGALADLPGYFASGVWASSQLEVGDSDLYRPVYLLWYWLVYGLAGPSAAAYHGALLALHALNAVLFLRLLEVLLPDARPEARLTGAALFAAHPAQVQAVGWISGGTDPVMAATFLGALLATLRARRHGRWAWLVAANLLYVAALLTKEPAIVLPGLVLVHHALSRRETSLGWGVLLVPFAATTVAYLALRSAVVGGTGLVFSAEGVVRLAEQAALVVRHLIVPLPHRFYFAYPAGGIAGGLDLGVALLGAVAGAYTVLRWRSARFWALWIVATSLVTLALAFHEAGVFALRFLYLPVAGLAAVGAIALDAGLTRSPRLAAGLLAAALALCALGTWRAGAHYRSEEAFYHLVIASDPQSEAGYVGLGRAAARDGRHDEALETYRHGLRQVPEGGDRVPLWERLALALAEAGRHEESLATCQAWYAEAAGADSLVGMGNNLWVLGRHREALRAYQQASALDPEDPWALANFGRLSASLGHEQEARLAFEAVLALPPEASEPGPREEALRFLGPR